MATYLIGITIEVEADNQDEAWRKANGLVAFVPKVVEVSEPEKAD